MKKIVTLSLATIAVLTLGACESKEMKACKRQMIQGIDEVCEAAFAYPEGSMERSFTLASMNLSEYKTLKECKGIKDTSKFKDMLEVQCAQMTK